MRRVIGVRAMHGISFNFRASPHVNSCTQFAVDLKDEAFRAVQYNSMTIQSFTTLSSSSMPQPTCTPLAARRHPTQIKNVVAGTDAIVNIVSWCRNNRTWQPFWILQNRYDHSQANAAQVLTILCDSMRDDARIPSRMASDKTHVPSAVSQNYRALR